jgi:hypothetical protein
MKQQATIEVMFLKEADGGRTNPIESDRYGCPILVGERALDCRFVLSGKTKFVPDVWHEIGVAFLSPSLAQELLSEGQPIQLWEGKVIAQGTVKSLHFN